MQEILYKKKGLNIQHIWFEKREFNNKADIVFIHDFNEKNFSCTHNYIMKIQNTVISDLSEDIQVIEKKINKNYRYEIRRAEKEKISIVMMSSKDLKENPQIIDRLGVCYESMFNNKGMNVLFNRKLVDKYIESDCFQVSIAKNEDDELVFHAYIIDKTTVRLLYACSLFRSDETNRNLIGRANKYLHWCDIKYFKEQGYEIYDWGGIMSFEEPNGIDQFKLKFGGRQVVHYNYIIGTSKVGKIVIHIMKFMRKI